MKHALLTRGLLLLSMVSWAYPQLFFRVVNFEQGKIEIQDTWNHNYIVTAVPNDGYCFYKWSDNDSKDPVRTICCLDDIYEYQVYFVEGHKITFRTLYSDSLANVPTGCAIEQMPIRNAEENYTFLGWSTTANSLTPDITFPYVPTEDKVLYPVYQLNKIIVTDYISSATLPITLDWSKNVDVIIKNRGTLTIAENSPSSQFTFRNITVEAGGKLVIPNNNFVSANRLILEAGDLNSEEVYQFVYPQLVVNGTLNVENDTVYYDYLLNNKQFYPFALPVDVDFAAIRYADGQKAVYAKDYELYCYDGATRANGTSGWKSVAAADKKVKAGIGYLIYAFPKAYLYEGNGTPVAANYSRLRMPLYIGKDFKEVGKSVSVSKYPSKTGKDNDAGWNFVGNPYFANYQKNVGGLVEGSNGIGLLQLNEFGEYEWVGTQRYVVLYANNGRAYYSVLAKNAVLPAFKPFFVQIGVGDVIKLPISNRAQNAPYRTQVQTEDEDLFAGIKLFSASNSTDVDQMAVLIGDNYTPSYEINADLQKLGHNEGVNVYAWLDNAELSFAAVSPDYAKNAVPLGYIAPAAGNYRFAMDESYDISAIKSVYLCDNKQKVAVDLMQQDYTFSASKGTDNTRFTISVITNQDAITANQLIKTDDTLLKIVKDGSLIIIRNGQCYRVDGTQVMQ